jgi:predicted small lipoprotein YifL
MSAARILLATVLAAALSVSGCGIKGDPIQPGSEKDKKKQTSG